MTEMRTVDLRRHLDDLRTRSHAGAEAWADKERLFRRAVELLDPVVRRVLGEVDDAWLDRTGEVSRDDSAEDPEGHLVSRWSLTWPAQRDAGIAPVLVAARFAPGRLHPHLGGTRARDWPLNVYDEADAERQVDVLRAIAESELHQRVFDADWRVVTRYRREHPEA